MTHQVTVGKRNKAFAKKGWASYPVSTRSQKVKLLNGTEGSMKWFHSEQEAQNYAADINAQQATGGVAVSGAAGTLHAAVELFEAHLNKRVEFGDLSYGTAETNIINAKSWLPSLGHLKCEAVTVAAIQKAIDALDIGRTTKQKKLTELANCLDVAKKQGWRTGDNPASKNGGVELFKKKHGRGEDEVRADAVSLLQFDKAKIEELVEYVLNQDRDYNERQLKRRVGIGHNRPPAQLKCSGLQVSFAFQTGLRWSEQHALRWCDVDFLNQNVTVVTAVRKAGKSALEIGDTKTALSRRVVPLAPKLSKLLSEWKLLSLYSSDDDFVFPTGLGTLHNSSSNTLKRVLKPACKAVGIDPLRWHDARHFFASCLLAQYGENWAKIADLLGHHSTDFTRKQYGHWVKKEDKDHQKDSQAMGNAFFG